MAEAEPRSGLPQSVLFACTLNAVRSPMAEALLKRLHGRRLYVASVGLRAAEIDPFAVAVMSEIGIDLKEHQAKTFEELTNEAFDLVVTLSPEAHHRALELTRVMACAVEYWPVLDATSIEGSRNARLEAYRSVRDALAQKIKARFPPVASASV
jgi:protein-tyrosine-phosphatase